MNQAEQAQKGFKTFILTLSISLIVFSAVYYFITNSSAISATPDIESDSQMTKSKEPADKTAEATTVFGSLAAQKITDVQPQAVLAGSDVASEPTQSTGTPQGGVVSITVGLITSIAIFLFGMFVIANDPRRTAIRSFEDKFTQS